jgi:effector-associated domain 5 (EAD5)-containing protein/TIR domain-containing protein
MTTHRLSEHLVGELYDAAIQVGLNREALLAGLPLRFTASLQQADTRAAQILLDLHALNRADSLDDGSVPLLKWLTNAAVLTTSLREGAVFAKAIAKLKQPSSPEDQPVKQEPATGSKGPVRIFVSTCDDDRSFVARLGTHLSALRRAGRITFWHPGLIAAGSVRADEIAREIAAADIVLAILSADYLANDETYREGEQALQAGKTVVPILARPAAVEQSPFAGRKALPANGVPVSKWADADSALVEIAQAITALVEAKITGPRRGA